MDRRAFGEPPRDRRGRRRRPSSDSRRSRPYRPRPAYTPTVEDSVYVHRDHRGHGIGARAPRRARRARARPRLPFGRSAASSAVTKRRSSCTRRAASTHVGVEREVGRKFGQVARRRDDADDAVTRRCGQWAGLDSNQRSGNATGLQPVPFGHSGTDPRSTIAALDSSSSTEEDAHADVRRRLRDRHARGAQRSRPDESRTCDTLRLQGHRQQRRAQGRTRSRSPPRPRNG